MAKKEKNDGKPGVGFRSPGARRSQRAIEVPIAHPNSILIVGVEHCRDEER